MKIALIAFGNEESYGLLFVAGELLKFRQQIRFFDAEKKDIEKEVVAWRPDFIFLSPMTTFFPQAVGIAAKIKAVLPKTISVFGGHHASSCPTISESDEVDVVVVGPVRGSIEKILDGEKDVIKTTPTTADDLPLPARKEYYRDIPRMASRYRVVMLSVLGCPWNCSYCSSACGHLRDIYGTSAHSRYFLSRRPIPIIIAEAREVLKYGKPSEIEWVDDDIFSGTDADTWIPEFLSAWEKDIGLPLYVSTTSFNALRISDRVLTRLKNVVNCIGMGVQAIRPDSLKLFNRSWDNEARMKQAYERLKSFGYSVNLQGIVGLPVADPVEDALDTIKGMQRIGPGSICSCYPLMVYPGTEMERYCLERDITLSQICMGDTNAGIPNISFSPEVTKRLKNICKLGTLFVKYGISEKWMRALIDIDCDDQTSKELSTVRYFECIRDRLKAKGETIFAEIMRATRLRY